MIRDRRKQTNLSDEERFKLWFGPYKTPQVEVDDWVECQIRGRVLVTGWWDRGRIPWPVAGGRPGCGVQGHARPIVFGDLERAIRKESSLAVQYWWGVSVATVLRWRKALEVEQYNEGTKQLYRNFMSQVFTPEVTAQAVQLAAADDVRRRAVETMQRRVTVNGPWTFEEERLLGTAPDRDVAEKLGRSLYSVERRRKEMGIRYYDVRAQKTRAEWIRKRLQEWVPVDARKLRELREIKALTAEEVAESIGVKPAHYEELENAVVHEMSRQHFEKLLIVHDCLPQTLLNTVYLESMRPKRIR